jgi:hypothetical protein
MCPANGELENGNQESPVEFLCQVAHVRAAALGVEVPSHGECEFCAGRRDEVLESGRRIAVKEVDVESWVGPQHLFPILDNVTTSSGCGTCGHH